MTTLLGGHKNVNETLKDVYQYIPQTEIVRSEEEEDLFLSVGRNSIAIIFDEFDLRIVEKRLRIYHFQI